MSLPRYSRYQETGVDWLGAVPAHWRVRRVGYFFSERREKVSDKDFQPLSVTKNGVVPQLETAAKTDDGDNRKLVCAGDFVINSRSDRKGSSGASDLDGSVSLINTVLRPESDISIRFAHYLFRSVPFQEEYYRFGKGIVADLWSTNYSEMRNISVAVPDLAEQNAIADFLDSETAKIEALITEQQKLLALLAEKRQANISNAVTKGLNPNAPMKDTGISGLGVVPAHWEVLPLRRRILRIEQGWSPSAGAEPRQDLEWGVLKISAIKFGSFIQEENKALLPGTEPDTSMQVAPGDLLLTRANTPNLVGDCCVVPQGCGLGLMMSDLIYRVKLTPQCNHAFFGYALRSTFGRAQIKSDARGSSMTMAKISQGHIASWLVAAPNEDEQNTIVAFLNGASKEIDALMSEVECAIALLEERRAALISAAVTGNIDVRGLVEPKEAA